MMPRLLCAACARWRYAQRCARAARDVRAAHEASVCSSCQLSPAALFAAEATMLPRFDTIERHFRALMPID